MRNPVYEVNPFALLPSPGESLVALGVEPAPTLSISIKTITHSRAGVRLQPHSVVAIEMSAGDELASFDLTPSLARHYADRLRQFADIIELKKAS